MFILKFVSIDTLQMSKAIRLGNLDMTSAICDRKLLNLKGIGWSITPMQLFSSYLFIDSKSMNYKVDLSGINIQNVKGWKIIH